MNRVKGFKIAAAAVLSITAIFWLFKGAADLMGGVPGGINNLFVAIVLFILTLGSWRWPLWGGIVTVSLAVVLIVYFNLVLPDIYTMAITFFLMFLPMAIAGLLFIEADWVSKKRV